MDDERKLIGNVSEEFWAAAYRPGRTEFAASTFAFRVEGGFVRIALGNWGPPVLPPKERMSVFTHAVTMTMTDALDFARKLRDSLAAPISSDSVKP